MHILIRKTFKRFTEFATMYIVLGILVLGYLYFLGNNSEPYEYVINILLLFDVVSFICFMSFFKWNRTKELKPSSINNRIFSIYLLNAIVFPILVFISIKYVNKTMYPMRYLFEKICTLHTVLIAFKLITPYFLLTTLVRHLIYKSEISKNKIDKLKLKNVGDSLKYQELKAQLSPHFLFNNLSVLTSLIEEDQKRAAHFSENLSLIYRYFLEKENEDVVPLSEELDFVNKYIELLEYRYENALRCSFTVDNSVKGYILPLAIQQAVENVTKHNEISVEKPMNIRVTIRNDRVVVENNINPKLGKRITSGVGIKNTKMRYSYFTSKKVKVSIVRNTYTIELPILTTQTL